MKADLKNLRAMFFCILSVLGITASIQFSTAVNATPAKASALKSSTKKADSPQKAKRVVFILDVSGSTIDIQDDLQRKLKARLASLKPDQEFQLIVAGWQQKNPKDFPGKNQFAKATDKNKKKVHFFLKKLKIEYHNEMYDSVRQALANIRNASIDDEKNLTYRIEVFTDGDFAFDDNKKAYKRLAQSTKKRSYKVEFNIFWIFEEGRDEFRDDDKKIARLFGAKSIELKKAPAEAPITSRVVIIIDATGSTVDKFDEIKQKVRERLNALKNNQEVMVVIMGGRGAKLKKNKGFFRFVRATAENKTKIAGALKSLQVSGAGDAEVSLAKGVGHIKSANSKKHLPSKIEIITDGAFYEPGLLEFYKKLTRRVNGIKFIAYVNAEDYEDEDVDGFANFVDRIKGTFKKFGEWN